MAVFLIQGKYRHAVMLAVGHIEEPPRRVNVNGAGPAVPGVIFRNGHKDLFAFKCSLFLIEVVKGRRAVLLIQHIAEPVIGMEYAVPGLRPGSGLGHKVLPQIPFLGINLKNRNLSYTLKPSLGWHQKPSAAAIQLHLVGMGNIAWASVSGYEFQFLNMPQGTVLIYGYHGYAAGLEIGHKKPFSRRIQGQMDGIGPVGVHRIHMGNGSILMDFV